MTTLDPPTREVTQPVAPQVLAVLQALNLDHGRADTLRPLFAPTFLALGAGHAAPVDREAFLQHAVPARKALFTAAHATVSTLTAAWQCPLGEHHLWVEGRWRLDLEGPDASSCTLASGLLLQRDNAGWHIVVYLNHQDVGDVLAAARSATGQPPRRADASAD